MQILKTYIKLCRICAILYTCMYAFFVRRPWIATTVFHCAWGCTLVQNKSCMNLFFYFYSHELFTCPLTFDSKVHARSSNRTQNFAIRKPYTQHKIIQCGSSYCMYRGRMYGKYLENTLTWTQFSKYQPFRWFPPVTQSCGRVSMEAS